MGAQLDEFTLWGKPLLHCVYVEESKETFDILFASEVGKFT